MRSLVLFSAAIALAPGLAQGHGGLPISQQIVWRGDTLFVSTSSWGLFTGTEGGPWAWICEEAINTNLYRVLAAGKDGTLYATALPGMNVSRDGGCTWDPVTGAIAGVPLLSVVADPSSPMRAWALSNEGAPAPGRLWRSDDGGKTWQPVYTPAGQVLTGMVLSADGQTLYLGAISRDPQGPWSIHASTDGGANFTSHPQTYTVAGDAPIAIVPLLVDERDARLLYLRVRGTSHEALLSAQGGGATVTEVLRPEVPVYDAARDPAQDRLLIATQEGMYARTGTSAPMKYGNLSWAECLSNPAGATGKMGGLYACSWNFAPDNAAVARSTDGGQSFEKVFQFQDTRGPLSCPATTPVGRLCPMYWAAYSSQFGTPPLPGNPGTGVGVHDAGSGSGGPAGGCQAAPGSALPSQREKGWCRFMPSAPAVLGVLAGLVLARRSRRRSAGAGRK